MFFRKRNHEEHRYYMLPGQGRSNRRVRRQQLAGAIIAGVIVSAAIGLTMWFLGRV